MKTLRVFWIAVFHVCFGCNIATAQLFESTTLPFFNSLDLIIIPELGGTTGIAVADYNNDSALDIYFVVHNESFANDIRTQNRLFAYDSDWYINTSNDLGSSGKGITNLVWSEYGFNIGASWGDYNNDGFADLFLANSGLDVLLKNKGDGTFEDVTSIAGVSGADSLQSSQGLWFDFDKDGDLDLYVSVREDRAVSNKVRANRMYENVGNDQFLDVSMSSGLADSGLTFTTLALDVNSDSNLDLYLANDFGANKMYINNGDKTFTEQTSQFGLTDLGEGMGLAIGDPDKNGFFDFYLTNVTENGDSELRFNRLFLNSGSNTFTNNEFSSNVSEAGWGWGTQFADFDNDGDEDLYVSNGYFTQSQADTNTLFLNELENDSLKFKKALDSGINQSSVSFTQAIFDVNDDGFLDILSSNFYQKPVLYLNQNSEGNWIKIWLEGVQTNRNGFGSTVEIETNEGVIKKYYHGAGLYNQHILPLHVGLGNSTIINRITVNWLNGETEEIVNITPNQTIRIKEFDGLVVSNEIQGEETNVTPKSIELLGNYPNPFNSGTVINFEIQESEQVSLEIYDLLGRQVFFEQSIFAKGRNSLRWIPNNINTGIYFYRISTPTYSRHSKLLYLK